MRERKSILITGASRGLGRTMALDLAGRGYTVFAGVRRNEDGSALVAAGGDNVRPLILDVISVHSIDSALAEVHRQLGGANLSGLVNNAAIFLLGPVEQTPLGAVENLFRVNVTGVVAVTQAFLPMLRGAKGRIVNVSSVNGRLSFPFSSFYSASKFAIEALSDALRVELSPWGIEVSVVEPGATRTDIRAAGARAWEESRGRLTPDEQEFYAAPFAGFQDILPQIDSGAADHHYVVDAVYRALMEDPPATRYLAGPDTEQWLRLASVPDRQRDREFIAMLAQRGSAGLANGGDRRLPNQPSADEVS